MPPDQQELCNGGVDCAAFRQDVLSFRLGKDGRLAEIGCNFGVCLWGWLWFGKVPEKKTWREYGGIGDM